jgi:uncharacterized protein YjbI with pentapeptide repeats
MRIVKPQALSLLTRPFENEGRCFLVVTVFAFFPFASPRSLLHESSLWLAAAAALGENGALDVGMAKTRGEVLVEGSAIPPRGEPAPATRVALHFEGPGGETIDKELYVFGDRTWGLLSPSDPAPFTEMPVTFERAFGGEGFAPNPVGRGYKPVSIDGKNVHLLPNIENPKAIVTSPRQQPAPAGFAALDIMSRERQRHVGTYDNKWLRTRFPNFAEDFHWEFWNTAPLDQRFQGFLQGDEAFSITGMNKESSTVKGSLPGVATRVFITQKNGEEEVFREAPSYQIDTVHLFPNVACGVVTFRCVFEVQEDDASDVACLLAGFEDPAAPKSTEHYKAALEKRLDKKNGALALLLDRDLMPGWGAPKVPEQSWNDLEEILKSEALLHKRAEANAQAKMEKLKADAIAAGLPPALVEEKFVMPRREVVPEDPEEMLAFATEKRAQADQMMLEQKETLKKAEDEVRDMMAARGLDYDEVVAKARAGGPPKLDMERNLEQLKAIGEGRAVNAEVLESIARAEAAQLDAYRRFTHFFPAARRLDGAANEEVVAELKVRRARGESLASIDLTGADLRGLDLSGADLREAMLEGANLEGVSLEGANLEGATLSRAILTNAKLAKARLLGTNFGEANLAGADLGGDIDMTGACFYKARAEGASLQGAKLAEVQFLEMTLRGADLSGADLEKALFMDADLEGARLARANLKDAICMRLRIAGANLDGAAVVGTTFVESDGKEASFLGADLSGARIVLDSDFAGAHFDRARFHRTCMRTTNFERATFVKAEMPEVDLSECNLRGADFTLANLASSLLMKADLSGAVMRESNLSMSLLTKARLYGADLSDAVLFRADMAKAKLDSNTNLAGADQRQVRVVPEKARPEAT